MWRLKGPVCNISRDLLVKSETENYTCTFQVSSNKYLLCFHLLIEERYEFSGTSEINTKVLDELTQPALCWTGNSADRTDCNLSFDNHN